MTMADTVAVMNAGVIEQMGSPVELYEQPRTTFVANFLGQSNLLRGTVRGSDGTSVGIEVEGARLHAPRDGDTAEGADVGEVWVGIRPEKIYLAAAGTDTGDDSNTLRDGAVVDVSFIGVSTQYLVRMPWGQQLTVFEQNTGARDRFRAGDKVDLHWMASHTFLLDASQDANAGVELEEGQ